MLDDRPSLLLVDRNMTHRQNITAKLAALYNISDFAVLTEALRHARLHPPSLMLVAEDVGRQEEFDYLKSLRLEPGFSQLPIIIVLNGDNPEQRFFAMQAGATACLAKPYQLSALLQVISNALNQSVEMRWERLPQLQAAALKNSVAVFANISDQIAAGDPIAFSEVKTACEPLLQAVGSKDVKHVLQGVRAHDNYTYAHSLRVAVFLSLFGSSIGLAEADLSVLTVGGLLHDLGKIAIPAMILNKPGKLDEDEFKIMKGHVPATMRILDKNPDLPKGVIIIAGQHHEKLDGTGYPYGLDGKKLNELARMAAIADVFGALTDRRVYKPAIPPERAFQIMAEEMTRHFDIRLLSHFRQVLLDTKLS